MPRHVRWEVRGAFFLLHLCKGEWEKVCPVIYIILFPDCCYTRLTYILYWAAVEIISSSCPTPCILGKLDNFLIAKVKTNHSFQLLFDFILVQNVAHSYIFCFKSWIYRLKNEKHILAECLCQTRGGTQGISWHWVITVSSIHAMLILYWSSEYTREPTTKSWRWEWTNCKVLLRWPFTSFCLSSLNFETLLYIASCMWLFWQVLCLHVPKEQGLMNKHSSLPCVIKFV